MSKFKLLIFISLTLSSSLFAQIKTYKKAISLFNNAFYDKAISEFNKVKEIDKSQEAQLQLYIADSYRLSNRHLASLPYYEKAIQLGTASKEALYYYAYALKVNEEYESAKANYTKFLASKSTLKTLNELANKELVNLQLLSDIQPLSPDIKFENYQEINSNKAEFGSVVLGEYLVYSAAKKEKVYANGQPYVGIYKVKIDKSLKPVGTPEVFSNNTFDEERNEASPTFSADGKIMIFARGNTGKRKDLSSNVDLYISRLVPNEGWTKASKVSVSDSAAWDGSPAFSRDGKTLYFSSDRAGGSGGLDIYRVNLDASGRFGSAVNMGKIINTPGDDFFPFVAPDGKLYFASDGHAGFGKLDIFRAVRSGGKISVENMGKPFNTASDDFGLFIDTKDNIFFSSNRAAGKGDDDLYYYYQPTKEDTLLAENDPKSPLYKEKPKVDPQENVLKKINYFLAGNIYGLQNENKVMLDSAIVRLIKVDGGLEEVVNEQFSIGGKFGPVKVDEDTDYILLAEKANYLTKREGFSMYGRSIPLKLLKKAETDTTFLTDLSLDQIFVGKTFKLENIYYDLDKFDIRDDAAPELDKLVQILKDNPQIKIELGSHTDTRGSDIYNIRLSQKRAESVINYLSIKGISAARLAAKGYGETELIVANAKNEDEHQINRRTEFKVLEINKVE